MATPQGTAERQGKLVTASRQFAHSEITVEEMVRITRENTPDHAEILLSVAEARTRPAPPPPGCFAWLRAMLLGRGPMCPAAPERAPG